MEVLGTLPGGEFALPTAINDFGQVVGGACIDSPYFTTHVFLWARLTGMQDLNGALPPNSGFEFTYANDVNLAGQVIGLWMIPGGVSLAR